MVAYCTQSLISVTRDIALFLLMLYGNRVRAHPTDNQRVTAMTYLPGTFAFTTRTEMVSMVLRMALRPHIQIARSILLPSFPLALPIAMTLVLAIRDDTISFEPKDPVFHGISKSHHTFPASISLRNSSSNLRKRIPPSIHRLLGDFYKDDEFIRLNIWTSRRTGCLAALYWPVDLLGSA